MSVLALDHVNIRTTDLPATVAFFRDVLQLRADVAPGAASIDRGCWIYDPADRPIVHIGPIDAAYPSDAVYPFRPTRGSGAVHHVALECADFDDVVARLTAHGHDYTVSHIPQIGLRQLFVAEHNGILLELNFRGN